MKLEFRDARLSDVGRFVRRMREGQEAAMSRKGINVHREVRSMLLASHYARVAFLGVEPFAMWGCTGGLSSPFGFVWLAATKLAEKCPLLLVKHAREEMARIVSGKEQLMTVISDGDEAAFRFAAFLGFSVSRETLEGGAAYSKEGRRRLVRHAK